MTDRAEFSSNFTRDIRSVLSLDTPRDHSKDDIVLISPTVHGMRSMLNTCDEYVKDFDVVFNGSKSKCIVNRPRRKSACVQMNVMCVFQLVAKI